MINNNVIFWAVVIGVFLITTFFLYVWIVFKIDTLQHTQFQNFTYLNSQIRKQKEGCYMFQVLRISDCKRFTVYATRVNFPCTIGEQVEFYLYLDGPNDPGDWKWVDSKLFKPIRPDYQKF